MMGEEELLFHFEGSRRVLKLQEGSILEIELEKELGIRFPDRDFAIASIGKRVPQSGSKDVFIIQKLTEKWGYVDVTARNEVKGGDELTLVKVPKLVSLLS